MSNRETKKIEINSKPLEIKTYVTAYEANTIQQAYFKGTKVELVGEVPTMKEVNPNIEFDVEKEMIKQLVVSFDGRTGDQAHEFITKSLPYEEYKEIIAVLNEITGSKKKK